MVAIRDGDKMVEVDPKKYEIRKVKKGVTLIVPRE